MVRTKYGTVVEYCSPTGTWYLEPLLRSLSKRVPVQGCLLVLAS